MGRIEIMRLTKLEFRNYLCFPFRSSKHDTYRVWIQLHLILNVFFKQNIATGYENRS